jgi:hypothetical protein
MGDWLVVGCGELKLDDLSPIAIPPDSTVDYTKLKLVVAALIYRRGFLQCGQQLLGAMFGNPCHQRL